MFMRCKLCGESTYQIEEDLDCGCIQYHVEFFLYEDECNEDPLEERYLWSRRGAEAVVVRAAEHNDPYGEYEFLFARCTQCPREGEPQPVSRFFRVYAQPVVRYQLTELDGENRR